MKGRRAPGNSRLAVCLCFAGKWALLSRQRTLTMFAGRPVTQPGDAGGMRFSRQRASPDFTVTGAPPRLRSFFIRLFYFSRFAWFAVALNVIRWRSPLEQRASLRSDAEADGRVESNGRRCKWTHVARRRLEIAFRVHQLPLASLNGNVCGAALVLRRSASPWQPNAPRDA